MTTQTTDFNRYRVMVTNMALTALDPVVTATNLGPSGSTSPGTIGPNAGCDQSNDHDSVSILIGATPGVLLLEDRPGLYPGLANGLKRLTRFHASPNNTTTPGHPPGPVRVSDTHGHQREIYFPFALHLYLAAFRKHYESLPGPLWGACEETLPRVVECTQWVQEYAETPPPPHQTGLVLWSSLCLCEQAILSQRDVDIELIDAVVHQVVNRPGPDGSLHPQESARDDTHDTGVASPQPANPHEASLDTWTYTELCGVHALANLALLRRNTTWAKRVERIALYHLDHTQPDHVTAHPWGVFAFLWSPKTRILADQIIHDTTASAATLASHPDPGAIASHRSQGSTHHTNDSGNPGRLGPLPGMLLADAAAALSAFPA